MIGGKFLERGRVKKPGQEVFKSKLSEYITAQDLYVGATLCLNNKDFHLLDADEYTLKYMEEHAEEVRRNVCFHSFSEVFMLKVHSYTVCEMI